MVRTLDEAIAYERGITDERKVLATKFEAVDNINMCLEYAEEHEQLAEWLEELKSYRECNVCEYNKAIDEAKSVILQTLDNEILVDTLNLRLEQLKAGGENETVL